MRGKTNRGPGLCAGSPLDSPRLARLDPPLSCAPLSHDPLPTCWASRPSVSLTGRLPINRWIAVALTLLYGFRFAPLQGHDCLLISYPPSQGRLSSFPSDRLPCSRSSSRTPSDNSRTEEKKVCGFNPLNWPV